MEQELTDYILGTDLGKKRDNACVVLLSRTLLETPEEEEYPYYYEVQFVEQLPLHTDYPLIVDYLLCPGPLDGLPGPDRFNSLEGARPPLALLHNAPNCQPLT